MRKNFQICQLTTKNSLRRTGSVVVFAGQVSKLLRSRWIAAVRTMTACTINTNIKSWRGFTISAVSTKLDVGQPALWKFHPEIIAGWVHHGVRSQTWSTRRITCHVIGYTWAHWLPDKCIPVSVCVQRSWISTLSNDASRNSISG